jgi:hypothetical protein
MALTQVNAAPPKEKKKSPLENFATVTKVGTSLANIADSDSTKKLLKLFTGDK